MKKLLLIIIILIGAFALDKIYTDNAVNTCIKNGVDQNVCEELRK